MVQTERGYNRWRQWRARQLERDLQFCHPRWPDERNYLESELRQLRSFQRTYFRQPWNIFEWVTYVVILVLMGTRIISAVMGNEFVEMVHTRVYTLSVLILWLRILRPCRAFRSLGPFIAILGSVVGDTLKFFFLLFEFYVPFTIGFFITFGGKENSQLMGVHSTDWKNINDIMFSLWQVSFVAVKMT